MGGSCVIGWVSEWQVGIVTRLPRVLNPMQLWPCDLTSASFQQKRLPILLLYPHSGDCLTELEAMSSPRNKGLTILKKKASIYCTWHEILLQIFPIYLNLHVSTIASQSPPKKRKDDFLYYTFAQKVKKKKKGRGEKSGRDRRREENDIGEAELFEVQ